MNLASPGLRRPQTRLGSGAEFDFIRSFLDGGANLPEAVRVGPGDDCAILDGGPLALTTDLSVEDVHFRRAWLTPEEIGWRAGASALSDLAAVAAEPLAVLVSLALTSDDARSGWGRRLMSGVGAAALEVGASVVGGDVSNSPGPAVVDVVAVGRGGAPILRSGARTGDEVWVTGALGAAGAAVQLLEKGQAVPDALRSAFSHPRPRVREALWLSRQTELHALIDLSDGLAGDAGHIAAASGVSIELDLASVPIAPGVDGAAGRSADALQLALTAGEDYELCIVAPPGALAQVAGAFLERFGIGLTHVGRVVVGEGVWGTDERGEPRPLARGGFSHFGRGEEAQGSQSGETGQTRATSR